MVGFRLLSESGSLPFHSSTLRKFGGDFVVESLVQVSSVILIHPRKAHHTTTLWWQSVGAESLLSLCLYVKLFLTLFCL